MTRTNDETLRLFERDAELDLPELPEGIDAAESRWDPWLLALAKIEAYEAEPRPN
jgi:hypothetical protein